MKRILLLYLIILVSVLPLPAQYGEIRGKIADENDQPLPGVNIAISGTVLGAASDLDGKFIIHRVPSGKLNLVISAMGYQQVKIDATLSPAQMLDMGIIQLTSVPLSGETVVVTASKYEQEIQNIPVSLSLISRRELQSRNIVTLDQALRYVPGVTMNETQMNIRGSTGYSKGVGSRVMFLLDGIPILTGDTREVSYDVLPTYLIQRVEIVKGAGSALYGSSALGGVVNIITPDIERSPHYYVKMFGGFYSQTTYDRWNWSDDRRFFSGLAGSTSRKIGNVGFQLGGAYDGSESYRQNDTRRRYSGSGKFQWSPSPYQQLAISGNYMHQERDNFLYWIDLNQPLQPPPDQIGDRVTSDRYYTSAQYRQIFSRQHLLTFRGIYFWNRFRDNIAAGGGNRSTSRNINSEIQLASQFNRFTLTTGLEGAFNTTQSNIFGEHSGYTLSGYLQLETAAIGNLRLTLGARGDYFDIDSLQSDMQVNPKLGATYSLTPVTTLRSSVGTGFRAPSLAEIFTSTDASGFQVIPNPNLKPEKSVSFEAGMNHFFTQRLNVDGAYFYGRYRDLIEGQFLASGEIQFQNITNARVQGADIAFTGEIHHRYLSSRLGYTYVDPVDLDSGDFLNFRPRHALYLNLHSDLFRLQLDADYRFIKAYDRIDEKLALVIEDVEQRVDAHVVDLRLGTGFQFSRLPMRISVQINNLFNYYYVDLVGSLAALRNYTLTLESGF